MTKTDSQVEIRSHRFGNLTLCAGDVIAFERPLLGLESNRRYALLELSEFEPFLWLQSIDEGDVCVAIADPWKFYHDYNPEFDPEMLADIGVEEQDEVAVYCIVCSGSNGLTMNLAAPLLLHLSKRSAGQMVLQNGDYPLDAPLRRPAC